jgi:hypothetical protein
MVFKAIFNNIPVISWWSVLLMKETEKTIDLSKVTDKCNHIYNVVSSAPRLIEIL